jgi:hypothetical protein
MNIVGIKNNYRGDLPTYEFLWAIRVFIPTGPFKPMPVSTGIPHPYERVRVSVGTGAGWQKFARG